MSKIKTKILILSIAASAAALALVFGLKEEKVSPAADIELQENTVYTNDPTGKVDINLVNNSQNSLNQCEAAVINAADINNIVGTVSDNVINCDIIKTYAINLDGNSFKMDVNWDNQNEVQYYAAVFNCQITDNDKEKIIESFSDIDTASDSFNVNYDDKVVTFKKLNVCYDNMPPVISTVSAVPEQWSNSKKICVTAEDSDSQQITGYSFDNGQTWQESNEYEVNDNGEIIIFTRDKAGNNSLSYKYQVNGIDKTLPEINSIDVNAETGYVTVSASDQQSGLAEQPYSFDGGSSWQSQASKKFYEPQDIHICVMDAVGNVSKKDEYINVHPKAEIIVDNEDAVNGWHNTADYAFTFTVDDTCHFDDNSIVLSANRNEDENIPKNNIKIKYNTDVVDVSAKYKGDNKFKIRVKAKDAGKSVESSLKIVVVKENAEQSVKNLNVKFDCIAPMLKMKNVSDSGSNSGWYNGDIVFIVTAIDNESGFDEQNVINSLKGNDSNIICTKETEENDYKLKISCPSDKPYLIQDYNFSVTDKAGNQSQPIGVNVRIDNSEPVITSINYKIENTQKNKFVNNDDTVDITISAQDQGSGFPDDGFKAYIKGKNNENVKIQFTPQSILNDSSGQNSKADYAAKVKISEIKDLLVDNQKLVIDWVELKDNAGNQCGMTWNSLADSGLVYYAPLDVQNGETLKVNCLVYDKDNNVKNSKYAKKGDILKVNVKCTHPISSLSGSINNEDVDFEKNQADPYKKGKDKTNSENDNNYIDGYYNYYADYVVGEMQLTDNSIFKIKYDLKDDALNQLSNELTNDIIYYAELKDSIKELKFYTSNENNTSIAKNGNIVTLHFETTHPVNIEEFSLAGIKDRINFETKDNMVWSAVIDIDESVKLSDNMEIPFGFRVSDSADNTPIEISNEDIENKVKYYAPITVNDLVIVSNNEKSKGVAKNGDTITVSFSSSHPVNIYDSKIAGRDIEFISDKDRLNWTAQINADDKIAEDNSFIAFGFKVSDEAGNDAVEKSEKDVSEGVMYYAPISLTGAKLLSTNEADAMRCVKDGDEVILAFTSNHDISVTDASIVGQKPEITTSAGNGVNQKWTLRYQVKNGDLNDLSGIAFSMSIDDKAGNGVIIADNDYLKGAGSLKYYAPLISSQTIGASGTNSQYAANGALIKISGTANHYAKPESAEIMGKTAEVSALSDGKYYVEYKIDENENSLNEGNVDFSYTLQDPAGNVMNINNASDGSSVIYDKTNPQIKAEYDKVSFSKNSLSYKFTFSDKYLSKENISVKINGEEQVTDSERNSITGTSFVKEIKLTADDNYEITASAKDLAGNSEKPKVNIKLTIDSSKPEIKTVNIDSGKPQIFRSEFNISEYFEIKDDNLSEIICTLTNSEGTQDWDIETPVKTEGKNTVCLLAKDMSGNVSSAMTYDFYIDSTAPKAVLLENNTGDLLESKKNNVFISGADLSIDLEAMNIKNVNEADKFKKIYITDAEGKKIIDVLKNVKNENGVYNVKLSEAGVYQICIEAEDSVGNKTGLVKYPVEIKEQSLANQISVHKGITALVITAAGLLIFAAVYIKIFRKTKESS